MHAQTIFDTNSYQMHQPLTQLNKDGFQQKRRQCEIDFSFLEVAVNNDSHVDPYRTKEYCYFAMKEMQPKKRERKTR